MSYDKPNRIKYTSGDVLDFGTAGEVYTFKGPKGKKGRIWDYGVEAILETFNSVTTAALVSVGSVADPDLYGDEFDVEDAAVDTGTVSLRTRFTAAEIEAGATANTAGMLLDPNLPADTIFALHCVAPTGGTPTGMAVAFVIVDWDD
jgi:hypothetical protein